VCVSELSVTYQGAVAPALRRVSLQAARGEVVLVMGATGSGKSTLLKVLARIVPCFQPAVVTGRVALLGEGIESRSVGDLAGTVGLVFQDFEAQLFSTNVLCEVAFAMEHLGLPAGDMPGRAAFALARVGLAGFSDRDPTTLSGGEKQRLALAGLLAFDPSILLLDEPTTDLDPVGKAEVLGLLGELRRRGRTVVVAEHEIAAARVADRIVLLRDGEVVANGEPRAILREVELLEECGVRPHDLARLFRRLDVPAGRWSDWLRELERPGSGETSAAALHEAAAASLVAAGYAPAGAPAAPPVPPATEPVRIAVEGVSFEYRGGFRALDDVSFGLGAGEFLAIIGQNGSGKTTLAKHLNGLLAPTSGVVRLDGTDLTRIEPHRRASEVGFVFQDPDHQLFAASVGEEIGFGPKNLGLAADEVERRTGRALDAVGLTHLRDVDPFLLDKGDRQRLAVASVLSMAPSILILDEPTTGLDYREQRRMMELLRRLNVGGTTIIIITHSPWVVAEFASRAILMARGRILWDGSLRRLFGAPELLAGAAFRVPDVTGVGQRLGVTALTVEELADALRRREDA
jgi:energy-coupling factor transport system ATP-binding protein